MLQPLQLVNNTWKETSMKASDFISHLRSVVGAAVIAAATISPQQAQGNLVVNGGFESPVILSQWSTFGPGPLGGWTISSGSVEILRSYWQPSEGLQSLDTAGNESGLIQQTITTVPGLTYRLTFDLSGNPDGGTTIKTLEAGFGASTQIFYFDTTLTTRTDMQWSSQTWDIVATTSSTVLSFANIGTGPYGAALDNVSLTVIPEPSIMAFACLGAVWLGVRAKKRPSA
jgi:choice-of-anchor C domain-containing protein